LEAFAGSATAAATAVIITIPPASPATAIIVTAASVTATAIVIAATASPGFIAVTSTAFFAGRTPPAVAVPAAIVVAAPA